MSNIKRISGALRVAQLSADPAVENGLIYYNTTLNKFRICENGTWADAGTDPDVQTAIDDLVTLSGVPVNSTDLGTFTGDTIPDSSNVKQALQALETGIENIPSPIYYAGTWDASTNTPTLDNSDTGMEGALYRVTVAGTVDFGAGNITFEVGDMVVNNGISWEKWDVIDNVMSVNGQSGVVVLDTDDVSEGSTNLYHTVARARTAAVVDSTAGNETDQAASVASMKTYVASQVGTGAAEDITYDNALSGLAATNVQDAIDEVVEDLADYIPLTQKGANNGVATLDAGGKIPVGQLPSSVMEYKGNWDADTNTPTLADGIGDSGDVYRVNVAGTQDLGSGSQTFAVGDWVVYNGTIWEKSNNSNAVMSVNGQTGVVSLSIDDISDVTITSPLDRHILFYDNNIGEWVNGYVTNDHISASAAIDVAKLANGTVSNTEFQYLDGVTSAIQTQLNGKASTTLNNLGTTAIAVNLVAAASNTYDLGTSSIPWRTLNTRNTLIYNASNAQIGRLDGTSRTIPSGASSTVNFVSEYSGSYNGAISVYSFDEGTANANATGSLYLETGNKTAGTGNSGSINIQTGTSAGGTRGNITLNSNVIIKQATSVRRQQSANNYVQEEYFHSIALATSQTDATISTLTFDKTVFEGCAMDYKLKANGKVRTGRVTIAVNNDAANGQADISCFDESVQTGDTTISAFDARVNGNNVEIFFTSGANAGVLRADVKKFLA